MSEEERETLKQQAKAYVRQLYLTHRNEDITAWDRIIDLVWMEIDLMIEHHCEDKHNE